MNSLFSLFLRRQPHFTHFRIYLTTLFQISADYVFNWIELFMYRLFGLYALHEIHEKNEEDLLLLKKQLLLPNRLAYNAQTSLRFMYIKWNTLVGMAQRIEQLPQLQTQANIQTQFLKPAWCGKKISRFIRASPQTTRDASKVCWYVLVIHHNSFLRISHFTSVSNPFTLTVQIDCF